MAFNIQDFKGRARNWLRPYSYTVVLNPPVGGGRELEIRTEEISLPGKAFMSVDNYKPYGNGLMLNIPHSLNIQEISCVHNIDGNGDLLKVFYDWTNIIVNSDGNVKYSAFYYDGYVTDMTINIYDIDNKKVKSYKLFEVYPSAIDQLQMGWGSVGEISKLNVTYTFRNYIIE